MAPRMKPLKDPKDLAAVPLDEPVLVDLGGADDPVEPVVEAREKQLQRRDREDEPEDGAAALQEQLDAAKAATAAAEKRATDERAARVKAERETAEARTRVADSEGEAVASGLAGAQAEQKAARLALKAAQDTGDADALADATERLARAASDIREFERSAAILDRDKETRKTEREAAPEPQPPSDINTVIDQMQLMPAERTWLKTNSDLLLNPRSRTKLDAAYIKSEEKGLRRGSAAYFKFIESELGIGDADAPEPEDIDERTPAVAAAPVSRDNHNFAGERRPRSQVLLTPAQRDMAQMMGLSDAEYARGVQQMDVDKRANPEKYATR